ncbi:uncharacterized protein LOC124157748 [Ischnura elegans]|uniref:uncharacterized protein LOC124157748 n=1 Tax=Ischnura elegans TaxID=197161 RepID=UPI001ED88604|nr:uncharacterized protein LOC124157748 [Ischnura elegans]
MQRRPRIKAFRKVKRNSSSGDEKKRDEGAKLTSFSRPSADRAAHNVRPQTRKKSLGSRRKKISERAKGSSNPSASENVESSSAVSSMGRKSPPMPWRNRTVHTVITGKNIEHIKAISKQPAFINPPMKFANPRPNVDPGMGHATTFPRKNFGITASRRVPQDINRASLEKEDMLQRKHMGDYSGIRTISLETNKKIDTLVTALASMLPPCGSKSQLDMVVGSFASALKEKMSPGLSQQKRDKKVPGTESGNHNIPRGNQRLSSNSSTVMNPTEAWVARCKGNTTGQRRVPMVASTGSTRPSKFQPSLVPQTAVVARKYGSTKIHNDSDDSGAKNDSDYSTKKGMKINR